MLPLPIFRPINWSASRLSIVKRGAMLEQVSPTTRSCCSARGILLYSSQRIVCLRLMHGEVRRFPTTFSQIPPCPYLSVQSPRSISLLLIYSLVFSQFYLASKKSMILLEPSLIPSVLTKNVCAFCTREKKNWEQVRVVSCVIGGLKCVPSPVIIRVGRQPPVHVKERRISNFITTSQRMLR